MLGSVQTSSHWREKRPWRVLNLLASALSQPRPVIPSFPSSTSPMDVDAPVTTALSTSIWLPMMSLSRHHLHDCFWVLLCLQNLRMNISSALTSMRFFSRHRFSGSLKALWAFHTSADVFHRSFLAEEANVSHFVFKQWPLFWCLWLVGLIKVIWHRWSG